MVSCYYNVIQIFSGLFEIHKYIQFINIFFLLLLFVTVSYFLSVYKINDIFNNLNINGRKNSFLIYLKFVFSTNYQI